MVLRVRSDEKRPQIASKTCRILFKIINAKNIFLDILINLLLRMFYLLTLSSLHLDSDFRALLQSFRSSMWLIMAEKDSLIILRVICFDFNF
jgi:hypothetical protein